MEYGGHDSRSYSWGTGETWCRVGASVSQTNSTSAYISFEGGVTSGNSSTGGGSYHRLSGYGVTCTVSTSSGGSSSASASYNYANWVAITSGGVWVSRTHNNYSVTITCSYSSYNGASNSGSVSTSVTIPKKDSHTITFNDNGGSGGPGSYTKWPGEDLVIPSTKPTRENYRFEGWSTSSTATSATYLAGTTYTGTDDKSYTLYAVWTLLYKAPTVTFVEAHRVDSATATDESALGTYMRAQFNWSVDTVIYPENTVKTIAATAVLSDSSTPTCTISGTTTGTSGTIYIVAPIATNLSGIISVIVTDSIKEGTGTANGSVGIGHIPFEVANGGTSVGILNSAGDANSITLGGLRLTDVHKDDLTTVSLGRLRALLKAPELLWSGLAKNSNTTITLGSDANYFTVFAATVKAGNWSGCTLIGVNNGSYVGFTLNDAWGMSGNDIIGCAAIRFTVSGLKWTLHSAARRSLYTGFTYNFDGVTAIYGLA